MHTVLKKLRMSNSRFRDEALRLRGAPQNLQAFACKSEMKTGFDAGLDCAAGRTVRPVGEANQRGLRARRFGAEFARLIRPRR
jgi:hypothetical protein